ncbi:hypothetical protein MTR_1g085265 [Medicago truncatula]|uniref:Uncharacterized protein n=1 Tax=Medicago truncatula TaxID=3880 RepID=A0A072VMS1_MEDTR|nr:hypothetical protein MTR_1g085265 [Medicago truncatula]
MEQAWTRFSQLSRKRKHIWHQTLNIKSINTLTGHQALNIRAKAHRASNPQRKSKSSQGIKPSTSNEYAWTQQRTT